jgi:hypothetical protein
VKALAEHITLLHGDRSFLDQLRAESLRTVDQITWAAAGVKLLQVYRDILEFRSIRGSVERQAECPV